MQQDIPDRFADYVGNSSLFFDRSGLDPHYTYAFLQGIYNVLRENKYPTGVDYEGLIAMLEDIVASDTKDKFIIEKRDRDMYDAWLANWNAVFNAAADVFKELLGENKPEELINFVGFRNRLLPIIKNFLSFPDPDLEDNTRENGTDPFGVAINSVRGKALQALILFVQKEDKKFDKDDEVKISDDVKRLYEDLLDHEDTYAVMFEYGHYLANFYYRDRNWIRGLFAKIFPLEPGNSVSSVSFLLFLGGFDIGVGSSSNAQSVFISFVIVSFVGARNGTSISFSCTTPFFLALLIPLTLLW
jgi:hypothetical protein